MPELWNACKISRPKEFTPYWWPLMYFPQNVVYIFCETCKSWPQREHEERFSWIIPKTHAGGLMGFITNGDGERRFAHNRCDTVPASQESIKVINRVSWILVLTQTISRRKKITKPTSLQCDHSFYNNAFTGTWAPSCDFSGWGKQQPSGRNACKVTHHSKASRPRFWKCLVQAATRVRTYSISMFSFPRKSASCRAEPQRQGDAEDSLLDELSTKQIKTNVCDKQQPFDKSAHSEDHIFSQTRPQLLFVLSHHCSETW